MVCTRYYCNSYGLADFPFTDAISSVAVHPSGIVFATSSGQRHTHKMFERKEPDAEDGTSGGSGTNGTSIKSDNSLKVWERYQPAVQP